MIIAVITGATASGKSAVALQLAEQYGLEIISADSKQVYKGFKIGTSQPTDAERARVPHHLVDFLPSDQSFSAGQFMQALSEFHRHDTPYLVVGGTGFYLSALLYGMTEIPDITDVIRSEVQTMIAQIGIPGLYRQLEQKDPSFVAKIPITDAYRIQRAFEVFLQTGKPYSSFLDVPKKGGIDLPLYSLDMDPPVLAGRIDQRVIQMIEAGWGAEAQSLLSLRKREDQAFGTLGYPEIIAWLQSQITLEHCIERIQAQTRQLAKRQRTYIRGQFPNRISCSNADELFRAFVAKTKSKGLFNGKWGFERG